MMFFASIVVCDGIFKALAHESSGRDVTPVFLAAFSF
jgi:hypothetical protein